MACLSDAKAYISQATQNARVGRLANTANSEERLKQGFGCCSTEICKKIRCNRADLMVETTPAE